MFDEAEFKVLSDLYRDSMRATKEFRKKHDLPLEGLDIDGRFEPLRKEHERMTGWANMHQNAIIHHRLCDYGPDCTECGKPLRTPKAGFCAECGHKQ